MCPGDREYLPARQGILREPLRAGDIPVAPIEYRFHERGPAGYDVPHYPNLGLQCNLIGSVPRDELDALRLELSAHRGIDIKIAPGHAMACRLRDRGNAAHESAADAEDVDMHGFSTARGDEKARHEKSRILAYFAAFSGCGMMTRVPLALMPKDSKSKQQQMRARIAAAAARLMAEDGLEDFALAKRKAARQLGAEDTQSLPKNDEIEAELRAYQSLYQGEEQRERIQYLRQCALEAMHLLERFRPYLAGPVLSGTAGRYSDIDLQLFTDDGKAVEHFLLSRNIAYDISDERRFAGDQARAVSVLKVDLRGVPVNLAIYTLKEERGILKATLAGRPIERAGIPAVTQLLSGPE